MMSVGEPPKFPWWVRYWTGPGTTRSGLQTDACILFCMAALFAGIGIYYRFWRPEGLGVVVLPVALVLMPGAFTVAGIWALVAIRWIDRHGAWDHVASREERAAHQQSQSLMARTLPWALLLMGAGGVAGASLAWVLATHVFVGLALGALLGFVVGEFLAGIKEGVAEGGRTRGGQPGVDRSRLPE